MSYKVARLVNGEYKGIPYVVAYNTSFEGYLAYIGIPKDNMNYPALLEIMERLDCNGGVTYPTNPDPDDIENVNRNHIFTEEECEKYYWIGWDYMHHQDAAKNYVGGIILTVLVTMDIYRTIEDLNVILDELCTDIDDE